MSNLKKKFRRKEWKNCCGKGCKSCDIGQTYIAEYGRKSGLTRLKADQRKVLAAKGDKKGKKQGKKKGKGKS